MAAVIVTPEFIDIDHPLIARAMLHHIISHGDVMSRDASGRTVLHFELAAPDWLLDKLAALGGGDEDREDHDPREDDGLT